MPTAERPRTFDEIRAALTAGTASVRGLLQHALDDAATLATSAWISRFSSTALIAQADACDALIRTEGRAAFDAQPLLGLTFAVKDNIDVAGLPTTAACPSFACGPAGAHAAVVQRLVDAGAIAIGKTNLDQFATGLVGRARRTAPCPTRSMRRASAAAPAPARPMLWRPAKCRLRSAPTPPAPAACPPVSATSAA